MKSRRGSENAARSHIEVRLLLAFALGTFLIFLAVPGLLRAVDSNGDNLDDAWEAQHGITTNAYDATNLVGWWQLDGTNSTDAATDRSGNGINGVLSNFPSNAYGPGLFDNALNFTNNASVNFPTTSPALSALSQFTFSTWFQSTSTNGVPATVATWSDASNNGWSVGVGTNGLANATFFVGANEQVVSASAGTANLYDGAWHQLALTYSTDQLATLYVDGESAAASTITNWAPGTVASFTFGAPDSDSTNPPYTLDEVRLYNRALGANEVPQLPVTYSDLNGSGLTVYDDYLEGLDPLSTNTTVTSSFVSSGLTSYYGTSSPSLAKTSGDGQAVPVSTFAASALVVQVKDASNNPLSGAPVTFSIPSNSAGGLSLTNGGATTTSVSLTTDSTGNATVYYQSGPDLMRNNSIVATAVSQAGSVSATFTEYCGVQGGLTAWFEANSGVTTDGSGNVTSLLDQVSEYAVTPPYSGQEPILVPNDCNGEPGLRFNGFQSLANPSRPNTGLNADMTIITVGMTTSPSATEFALYLGQNATAGANRGVVYAGNQTLLDTQFAGFVGGSVPAGNTFVVDAVTIDSTQSTATFYRNGIEVDTASRVGGAIQNLSSGITMGAAPVGAAAWQGDIVEQLVYNHQLSSTELQQIGVYLADKYGLYNPNATWPLTYSSSVQAEITANQWNKSQADTYAPLIDGGFTEPTGLVVWLRADEGVTTSNGSVMAITDQSSNGYTLTQDTSGDQPAFIANDLNGLPGLRFNGSQFLINSDASLAGLNADMTVVTLGMTTAPSETQFALYLGQNAAPGANRDVAYAGQVLLDTQFAGFAGDAVPAANTFVVDAVTVDSTLSTATFYRNGVDTGTTSEVGGTIQNLSSGITMGAAPQGIVGWQGDLVEQLVYDHQLSTSELQWVDVYLANKYGLYNPGAAWVLSAPYTSIGGLITANQWSKAQADAYLSSTPSIAIVGTNPQTGFAGGALPLEVRVANGTGTPLANASVTFTVVTGGGQLVSDPLSTDMLTSLQVATGEDGTATIYYIQPNSAGLTSSISAQTGGQSVTFTTTTQTFTPAIAGGEFQALTLPDTGNLTQLTGSDPPSTPIGLSGVIGMAVGDAHSVAVESDGKVYAWGSDSNGQLGDGNVGGVSASPVMVRTAGLGSPCLSGVTAVAAGTAHTIALQGTQVLAWGSNDYGQLGNGTLNDSVTPVTVQFPAGTNIVAIAAHADYSMAIDDQGNVWAWGDDSRGQLGDGGALGSIPVPVPVAGVSNVTAISAGYVSGMALETDPLTGNTSVWTWGDDGSGELGQGDSPVDGGPGQVAGLSNVAAICAGLLSDYVVKNDGTVWAWGDNTFDELGNGSNVPTDSPIQVTGFTNTGGTAAIRSVAATYYSAIALDANGAIWTWGGPQNTPSVPTMLPLSITTTTTDTNNNGIPDSWEEQYTGALVPDAFAQAYNGTYSYIQDYQLGLSPLFPVLEPVQNLTETAVSGGIELTWTVPAGNPDTGGIQVQQEDSSGNWSTVATLGANQTQYFLPVSAGSTPPPVQIATADSNGNQAGSVAPPPGGNPPPAPRYAVIDLGSGGSQSGVPYKIADTGQVLDGNSVWNNGTWTTLTGGVVADMNSSGVVVGSASSISDFNQWLGNIYYDYTAQSWVYTGGYAVNQTEGATWAVGALAPSLDAGPVFNVDYDYDVLDPATGEWHTGPTPGSQSFKEFTMIDSMGNKYGLEENQSVGSQIVQPINDSDFKTVTNLYEFPSNMLSSYAIASDGSNEVTGTGAQLLAVSSVGTVLVQDPDYTQSNPVYTLIANGTTLTTTPAGSDYGPTVSFGNAYYPNDSGALAYVATWLNPTAGGTPLLKSATGTQTLPAAPVAINNRTTGGLPDYQILYSRGLMESSLDPVKGTPNGQYTTATDITNLLSSDTLQSWSGFNLVSINKDGAIVGTATYQPPAVNGVLPPTEQHRVMLLPIDIEQETTNGSGQYETIDAAPIFPNDNGVGRGPQPNQGSPKGIFVLLSSDLETTAVGTMNASVGGPGGYFTGTLIETSANSGVFVDANNAVTITLPVGTTTSAAQIDVLNATINSTSLGFNNTKLSLVESDVDSLYFSSPFQSAEIIFDGAYNPSVVNSIHVNLGLQAVSTDGVIAPFAPISLNLSETSAGSETFIDSASGMTVNLSTSNGSSLSSAESFLATFSGGAVGTTPIACTLTETANSSLDFTSLATSGDQGAAPGSDVTPDDPQMTGDGIFYFRVKGFSNSMTLSIQTNVGAAQSVTLNPDPNNPGSLISGKILLIPQDSNGPTSYANIPNVLEMAADTNSTSTSKATLNVVGITTVIGGVVTPLYDKFKSVSGMFLGESFLSTQGVSNALKAESTGGYFDETLHHLDNIKPLVDSNLGLQGNSIPDLSTDKTALLTAIPDFRFLYLLSHSWSEFPKTTTSPPIQIPFQTLWVDLPADDMNVLDHEISPEDVAGVNNNHRYQLVFLNCCNSANTTATSPSGLPAGVGPYNNRVQAMVDAFKCQAYVGWTQTVGGPKALVDAQAFFSALKGVTTVDQAAIEANNTALPNGVASDSAQLVSVLPSTGGAGGGLTANELKQPQQ